MFTNPKLCLKYTHLKSQLHLPGDKEFSTSIYNWHDWRLAVMPGIVLLNPSGRAPALTLAGYAPCDRAPPEMHPLKMFEILGHPHFKQLHGHKIPMNATNLPDRLNLYIFSLNLSYHSFVSVHDIQQKRLLNKISVYAFTHPGGHHRVANATLSVACTRDVVRGHVNHVITIMTLNSFTEFRNL